MRAIWNDNLIAESDHTVVVEGNHYYPPDGVRWQHLADSDTRTVCHWKGRPRTTHWFTFTDGSPLSATAAFMMTRSSACACARCVSRSGSRSSYQAPTRSSVSSANRSAPRSGRMTRLDCES